MNPTKLKLLLTCLALAVTSGVALAQAIPLTNPSFEEPNLGKLAAGYTFTGVPGWLDSGVTYADTGVENTGARTGVYRAYQQSSDDGAFQTAGYQIAASGDTVYLSWYAMGSWNGSTGTFDGTGANDPVQTVRLLRADILNDFASTVALATTNSGLIGGLGWIKYTLTYTTTPADLGKYVGIYFDTTNTAGVAGSYSAFDDFSLAVLPAGSKPIVIMPPASATVFAGATVSLTVDAVGATSYQWRAGAVGGGVHTNLSIGGQFGGTTTDTLTITNVTKADNQADYVVVVSNGNGSVTSAPPATLTVSSVLYRETFVVTNSGDQPITQAGWRNDIEGQNTRIYHVAGTNGAVWSFRGAAGPEAFYATTVTANGSLAYHMAFPSINLATVENLVFSVDLNSTWQPALVHSYFAVQINWGSWYVSTTELLPVPTGTYASYNLTFDPSASGWNELTVSGSGSVGNASFPTVGVTAAANLSGYITGAGIVSVHDGSSTHNFDSFTIAGAIPPTALPVINSPPFSRTNFTGTTTTFSVSATTNGVTAGLTYQWRAGTVGSGVYANLTDGGQFSGTTSSTLVISNVTSAANNKDYVVVVTDGAGSVTSAPPARLTVVNSSPFLVTDTTITPNAVHVGNNNIITLAASFDGNQPMSFQWKVSPNADGSGAVNKPGATASTLTLSNPQESDAGYYSLQASNGVSPFTSSSAWVQLQVLPASTAFFKWSAPVPILGKTAADILGGPPGTFVGAALITGTGGTVTVGGTDFVFVTDGTVATMTGVGGPGTGAGTFIGFGTTGDANFDAILDQTGEVGGAPDITLHNLTIDQRYSVQLFALDNLHDPSRAQSFADPNDLADVSRTYTVGDNAYIIGTFVANNTDVTIRQVLPTFHGYFGSLVVRQVPTTPTLSIQRVGSSLQVDYADGTLLEATDITGPWTTNTTTTPYTFTPAGASRFFRVQGP